MSGDSLRKVKSGDPLRIPAGAYNAFVDAAVDLRRRQHEESREPQRLRRDNDVILVLNSTGSTVNRFGVLAITDPIIAPTDALELERVAFTGVVPAAEHAGKFAILLETAAPGAIVRAAMGGVVPVKIGMASSDDEFADVSPGLTDRLLSGDSGAAQILWVESSISTLRQAIVRLPAGCAAVCLAGASGLAFDASGCLKIDTNVNSTVQLTLVTGVTHAIVGNVLRITAQRSIITLSRNVAGVVIGVGATPTTDQTSDVNLESCP
ncbi:MAG: hypothetical protein IT430_02855 [Phycisphaerales bacterium]|nr:hypothetical protein [Phycisphaerales bacterium]